jgi:predicted nucleic acid-binding protein
MSVKTFVDTNILVYAHDVDQGQKHLTARDILIELMQDRSGALSPQILQEFYFTVTRKIAKPLSKRAAREIVADLSIWCIETTAAEVAAAFRIEDEAKINFWDALILASAVKSGAEVLLSEDLSSGQKVAGIRIQNPFI